MNSKSKIIANFGIIAALNLVAIAIDTAISKAGLPVNIAITSIIVVLVICQTNDLKTAVFAASTFGLFSFIRSYIIASPTAWYFQNPLISIVPRIIIGFTCHLSLILFKKILKRFKNNVARTIPFIISGAVGVLTNTVLVLSMMAVFDNTSAWGKIVGTILAINFLIEFLCAVLIVPTISRVTLRARRNSDIKPEPNAEDENKEDITLQDTL